jgi:hypothetical protein
MRLIWPVYLEIGKQFKLPKFIQSLVYSTIQNALIIIICSCFFTILYIGKFTIFENMRSDPLEKWPWEQMENSDW